MNKKMIGALCSVLAAIILIPAFAGSAQAQKMDSSKMKRAKIDGSKGVKSSGGSKGADANITTSDRTNGAAEPALPAGKSGSKGAARCGIIADNYTNYYIKLYVDGAYEGTISRYGELEAFPIAGSTVVYARAEFTDGSYYNWGPRRFNCEPGSVYTWRIEN